METYLQGIMIYYAYSSLDHLLTYAHKYTDALRNNEYIV